MPWPVRPSAAAMAAWEPYGRQTPSEGQLDAAADLITLLQTLPSCSMRRGVRYPQWWMLLVAILAILSGQGSWGSPAFVDTDQGFTTAGEPHSSCNTHW
jgi:hypothetical protein